MHLSVGIPSFYANDNRKFQISCAIAFSHFLQYCSGFSILFIYSDKYACHMGVCVCMFFSSSRRDITVVIAFE